MNNNCKCHAYQSFFLHVFSSQAHCIMSGILRYFQPKLPSSSQVQMPPTILHEVNEAVTAALDEEKRGKKRKYNTSYTPEDECSRMNVGTSQLLKTQTSYFFTFAIY